MEFFMLGPLAAEADGERLELGGPRHRVVLATLLLDANRMVPVGRLMEAVYHGRPPATSRGQIQSCVSVLRRLFGTRGHPGLISSTPQGYAIRIPPERIDAYRFEATVNRARRCPHPADAVALYREARALWQGHALEGLRSPLLQAAASRLTEMRITAAEECMELELELGDPGRLVGELSRLVLEHPLRERFRAQLMTALHRAGRRAEALDVYQRTEQSWAGDFGIEPGEELRRTYEAIIADQEHGTALPPAVADFTGRTGQMTQIMRLLQVRALAVPIIVIVGRPGAGKTSLAVQVAHRAPAGGRLFAAMCGSAARPVSPHHVLGQFLGELGVPGPPADVEERAEIFRDLARRTLVVLDDAADEAQVRPLLPGDPGSAVLITSRGRLPGLPGAVHVDVPVFEPDQSVELLSRIAGPQAREDPQQAAELAELAGLCGHLPLALRIAGTRLPGRGLRDLVARLRDETRRLDELRYGDLGVRAGLTVAYDRLGDDARRLFRRLAILDVPALPVWTAAALLGGTTRDAEDLMDELADVHLVDAVGAGRYRFHDLVKVFARERLAREEPPADRTEALNRLIAGALTLLTRKPEEARMMAGAAVRALEMAGVQPSPHPVVQLSSHPGVQPSSHPVDTGVRDGPGGERRSPGPQLSVFLSGCSGE
ncbi:hypothetical protein J5X84_16070 [Streptosporangiaceae bacterium NEAU-GS5]|nr:hypothetical protein [Streptosporangiaceae bacterium NEAU-GS5]